MLLTMDIGNSNIVFGLYKEDKLLFLSRLATNTQMEADQYAIQLQAILQLYGASPADIGQIMIGSVVPPLTPVVLSALSRITAAPAHLFTNSDHCGVTVAIDNPAELGSDILASAIAVLATRPLPAVIIDMGTATKITALDENGHLLGVAISPGLYISNSALVQKASALRGIPLSNPGRAIGRNTAESMKSGVLYGTAAMLDGMIDRFSAEMGAANGLGTIVATGGGAAAVICHCRHQIEHSDTLLLEGLRIAAKHKFTEATA